MRASLKSFTRILNLVRGTTLSDLPLIFVIIAKLRRVHTRLRRYAFEHTVRTVATARHSTRTEHGREGGLTEVTRKCHWIDLCAAIVPGTYTCLDRAVVASVLCSRSGFAPLLRIGVRRTPSGGFDAHAWVEFDGHVVLGQVRELAEFQVFDRTASLFGQEARPTEHLG